MCVNSSHPCSFSARHVYWKKEILWDKAGVLLQRNKLTFAVSDPLASRMCSVDRMPSISLTSVKSSSESTVERTEYLGSAFPVGCPFSGIISTPSCSFSHTHSKWDWRPINDIVKVDYYFEPMEFGKWLGDCDAFKHDSITSWFEHVLRFFRFVQYDRLWWWRVIFVTTTFASFLHRFVCKMGNFLKKII